MAVESDFKKNYQHEAVFGLWTHLNKKRHSNFHLNGVQFSERSKPAGNRFVFFVFN